MRTLLATSTLAWLAISCAAGDSPESEPEVPAAAVLVGRLDLERFKGDIETLAGLGTRHFGTSGNLEALDWLQAELESYGYQVERHVFAPNGSDSIYATKVGTVSPDRMYLVSAHMDSFNTESSDQAFAPGADDDASGTSLVLEMARVFASADVQTEVSVRFALWNGEEIGLAGSRSYVTDRMALRGVESPLGSGIFPEPDWLGIVQHDMILFDHGMPDPATGLVPESQHAAADVDIEYDADQTFSNGAIDLAAKFLSANARYASYPAEVGQFMQSTDSASFAAHAPAISVRENERRDEIGRGANPNWHRDSDVFATYDDADFQLGFAALETSTAAIAELSGASVAPE